MYRLLGLRDLVHDAIDAITTLVEETHEAAARKPVALLSRVEPLGRVAEQVDGVRSVVARSVFDGVRGTNRVVRSLGDRGIALATDALERAGLEVPSELERAAAGFASPQSAFTAWIDRGESALNGVIGDFLATRGNALATRMCLRRDGVALDIGRQELSRALPDASGKLCILIHGLASSDSVWDAAASPAPVAAVPLSFGTALSRELGYSVLCLRYNSGLHVSENGRQFALLLEDLVQAYPRELDQIVLVGHSMGGLVARSAAHYGRELGASWVGKLTHILGIGSPHLGAPLARAGHVVAAVAGLFDTAGTQVPAKVLRARSAGLKDLSFGALLDDDWLREGSEAANLFGAPLHAAAPFVDGVAYGYVAARFRPGDNGPFGEWLGDLLVQVPSASGHHRDPARRIPFHMGHIVDGAHHVALTTHPDVYRQLLRFLIEFRR